MYVTSIAEIESLSDSGVSIPLLHTINIDISVEHRPINVIGYRRLFVNILEHL